jgi:hypothetical protein
VIRIIRTKNFEWNSCHPKSVWRRGRFFLREVDRIDAATPRITEAEQEEWEQLYWHWLMEPERV